MLDESAQNPALQYASKAVSRMTLADRYSGTDPRLDPRDEYAKALKSVSDMMSDHDEAVKDEAVTAVWLLGLYEVGLLDGLDPEYKILTDLGNKFSTESRS